MRLLNEESGGVYETTSSCSGRIAVFAEKRGNMSGSWLFVSHDPVDISASITATDNGRDVVDAQRQFLSSLFSSEITIDYASSKSALHTDFQDMQPVYFKFEPFILHVAAPTVDQGQALLATAFDAGYRTSGLIHGKKRCMVQLKDTLKIDAPIGFYNPATKILSLIVDKSYIIYLVVLSNQKFTENERRMEKLLGHLTTFCAAVGKKVKE